MWQPTPFTVPFLASALASFTIVGYVASRRDRGSRLLVDSFLGVALGSGVWALTYALQTAAPSLGAKLIWLRFVWVGIAAIAGSWPVFVLAFTGREDWLTTRRMAGLWAVPAVAVAAVWILGPAGLFYLDPAVDASAGYAVMTFTPGPLLLAVTAYLHTVSLVTFVLLGYVAVRRRGVFRRQAVLLLFIGAVPSAVAIAGLFDRAGPTYVDLTPMAFSLTAVLSAFVLFKYRLLDLSPVARDAVFADLDDGVVVLDPRDRVVDANDSARQLFPELRVGDPLDDTFDEFPAVIDAARDPDGTGDTRFAAGCDETRVVDLVVLDVDGGGATGTVLLFRDVTERETLQRRYRALIEKSPNVIAVVDGDLTLRYVSPSVERLLGYDAAELVGRPAAAIVHPDDRDDLRRAIEATRRTGEGRVIEHRGEGPDGARRRFETVVDELFEGTDEVVLTATDVTESRRYEQRLQVLNRVLRHDLKNDVNVVGGYAGLLRDHVDEEGHRHLDVIDRKVDTLTHLSEQAREIDVALHRRSDPTEIDLVTLVRSVANGVDDAFPAASVNVTTPEEAVVRADSLIESAVRNVVENAVIHNDGDAPTVSIAVERSGGRVRLAVRDDGPGIPAAEREVFSQRRETALEHASGLGLWLVHWIVTESGGDLTIADREPRGTEVTMSLPAADSPAGSQSSHSAASR